MMTRCRSCFRVAVGSMTLLGAVLAAPTWGQDDATKGAAPADSPFDEGDSDDAAQPANPNAQPAGPAPAAPPNRAARNSPATNLKAHDPIVQGILKSPPQEPAQLLEAVFTVVDLGDPAAAGQLLQRIVDANLENSQLAELVDQLGSARIVRLSHLDELQPTSGQFAAKIFAAADALSRNPQLIQSYIQQLSATDPELRRKAVRGLRKGRDVAVTSLVSELAKSSDDGQSSRLMRALVAMDVEAHAPLVAIIYSDNEILAAQAMEILGRSKAKSFEMHLLAPALDENRSASIRQSALTALSRLGNPDPQRTTAAAQLYQEAKAKLRARTATASGVTTTEVAWNWDSASGGLQREALPHERASIMHAARLAKACFSLRPTSQEAKLLYLLTMAESAHDRAAAVGSLTNENLRTLEQLLAAATEGEFGNAALLAAQAMVAKGGLSQLQGVAGAPSPLVRLTQNPDRQLRFAGLSAVMQLNPQSGFSGSHMVSAALMEFAKPKVSRRVLVVSKNQTEAQRIVGLFAALNYEAFAAFSNREMSALLNDDPDFEFAIIDLSLVRDRSGEVLQKLRQDYRVKKMPIGIISAADDYREAERLSRVAALTSVMIRPVSLETLEYQVNELVSLRQVQQGSAEESAAQYDQALQWIGRLSESPPVWFKLSDFSDVILSAAASAESPETMLPILSRLGNPDSQRKLLEVAGQPNAPIELRRQAVEGFSQSLEKFGLLLTHSEVEQQYDRYNRSESESPESQAVLSQILDLMEARAELARQR